MKLIKITVLSFLVLVLIFILVNQFDEQLDPELQVILARTYPAVPDEKNAFYAYAGFYAPEGEDIADAGKRIVDEYRKSTLPGKSLDFDDGQVLGENKIELEDDGVQLCKEASKRSYCLSNIRASIDKTETSIGMNRILVDRYYSLFKYRQFQSNSSYLPTTPFSVHKYVLGDIAIKWIRGSRKEAIGLLIDDIHFHRMLGREARLLINKMIALAGLAHSYGLLHDFINECHSCVLEDDRINSVLTSLDEDMLLSHRVMEGEVRWAYTTTMEILESSPSRYDFFKQALRWEAAGDPEHVWYGLLGYVTLVNASINQGFRNNQQPNLQLSRYRFREFEKQLVDIRKKREQAGYSWWQYFYNPGGKYLSTLYEMDPIYSRYFEVPFQLEARIRLIRLQLLIKKNRIDESNIGPFLRRQPKANQDPYSNEPVKYDATEKILYIVPFSRDDEKLIVFL